MPGKKYASLKNPDVYEALKKKGMSKEKAARISNAKANKKKKGKSKPKGKPGKSKKSKKKMPMREKQMMKDMGY